jgi:hypothetical protein
VRQLLAAEAHAAAEKAAAIAAKNTAATPAEPAKRMSAEELTAMREQYDLQQHKRRSSLDAEDRALRDALRRTPTYLDQQQLSLSEIEAAMADHISVWQAYPAAMEALDVCAQYAQSLAGAGERVLRVRLADCTPRRAS